MKEERKLFYVKPAMSLDQKRRYLRLTPDEAVIESKKAMYKERSEVYKSIVRIEVNSPSTTEYVIIFVEHPSLQRKSASDIYEDWKSWMEDSMWNLGFDGWSFDEYLRIDW